MPNNYHLTRSFDRQLRFGILSALVIASFSLSHYLSALTVTTPAQNVINNNNPATIDLNQESLDGGLLGPIRVSAESVPNQTLFQWDLKLENPSGNILGDNAPAFVQFSHPIQPSNSTVTNLNIGAYNMHVKLQEPAASLTAQIKALANNTEVPGVEITCQFAGSTGCTVGQFCTLNCSQTFSVNIPNVNSLGIRWDFTANGSLILAPGAIFDDGFESGNTFAWSGGRN